MIQRYSIREFTFSSGTLSADDMASILNSNLNRIFKFIQKQRPPFIAALAKDGVHLRFPSKAPTKGE